MCSSDLYVAIRVAILTGMWEIRLGDEIDDYCVKCRRLTNHLIVSLLDGKVAKVRCRSCYSDHDYRNEIAPPSKKELAKQKLFNSVLAGVAPPEPQATSADPPEEKLPDEKPKAKKKS